MKNPPDFFGKKKSAAQHSFAVKTITKLFFKNKVRNNLLFCLEVPQHAISHLHLKRYS